MNIRQAKKVGRLHEEVGVDVNRIGTVVEATRVLDQAHRRGRARRWKVRDRRRSGPPGGTSA